MSIENDGYGVLDLVHESVVILDLAGRILVWNTASEALYGWTRAQAVGLEARSLYSRDAAGATDSSADDGTMRSVVATGAWEGEAARRTADGRLLTVDVRRTLRRDERGEPLHVVESGRDLTAKKSEEARYSSIEHRYHNLFQALAASIWEVDFSPIDEILRELLAAGVTDFRAHLAANPQVVRRMMSVAQVLDVNDRTVALFGRGSKQEILGPADRFWAEGSEPVFAAAMLAGVAKKPGYSSEVELRTIDGRVFDALMTISYPSATMGKGSLVVGVIDLSDQKRADAALRLSEYRYRSLFGAMAVAYLELDFEQLDPLLDELRASGVTDIAAHLEQHPELGARIEDAVVIVDANEKSVELFRAASVQAVLGGTRRYWTPESRRVFYRLMAGRAAKGPAHAAEIQLRAHDGTILDVQITTWAPPLRLPGQRGLAALIDIGERTRAHSELSRSEARYRALFQRVPTALVQLDVSAMFPYFAALRASGVTDLVRYAETSPDFVEQYVDLMVAVEVNEAARRLFGCATKEELKGPVGWVWKASPGTFRRSTAARLRGDEAFSEETKLVTPDGRVIDVLYTIAFSAELADLAINVVSLIDLSERTRAQATIEQMRSDFAHSARVSMLGELTASIAHEVSQPLTGILSDASASLRWIDRPEPNLDEARSAMRRVVGDTRRAAEILSRVRAMAKKEPPDRLETSVNAVVEEAAQFLRYESVARRILLVLDLSPSEPRARLDRTQIQQVLVNLAVNAMQAMDGYDGGKVVVRTRLDGGVVRVSVEDSGPGIAPEVAGKLFQSFFTTKDEGMGMGLRICRSIIEAHAGSLEATAAPGGGAVLSFTLPAAPLPAVHEPPAGEGN